MKYLTADELTTRACKALGIPRKQGGPILAMLLICQDQELERARRAVAAALIGQVPLDVHEQVMRSLEASDPYPENTGKFAGYRTHRQFRKFYRKPLSGMGHTED